MLDEFTVIVIIIIIRRSGIDPIPPTVKSLGLAKRALSTIPAQIGLFMASFTVTHLLSHVLHISHSIMHPSATTPQGCPIGCTCPGQCPGTFVTKIGRLTTLLTGQRAACLSHLNLLSLIMTLSRAGLQIPQGKSVLLQEGGAGRQAQVL